jgi:hypothetical protein
MPVFYASLKLGAIFVKASMITSVDNRSTIVLSFVILVALAAFSGIADARGCGMMKVCFIPNITHER